MSIEARAKRLEDVFIKTNEASVASITDSDLSECFCEEINEKSMKQLFGNALQKLFLNFVSRTQGNIQVSFKDVCITHDIEDILSQIDSAVDKSALSLEGQKELELDSLSRKNKLISSVKEEQKNQLLHNVSKLEEETLEVRRKHSNLLQEVKQGLGTLHEMKSNLNFSC